MKRLGLVSILLASICLPAHVALAQVDTGTISGTVKDSASGQVTNWGAEMGAAHQLQRGGWRRDTLKIGEEVTVEGSLARNGTKRLNARVVKLTSTGGRPGEILDAASSQN